MSDRLVHWIIGATVAAALLFLAGAEIVDHRSELRFCEGYCATRGGVAEHSCNVLAADSGLCRCVDGSYL